MEHNIYESNNRREVIIPVLRMISFGVNLRATGDSLRLSAQSASLRTFRVPLDGFRQASGPINSKLSFRSSVRSLPDRSIGKSN